MDFRDAIIFLAAVIVVVGAGVVLGMALQRKKRPLPPHVQNERLRTYSELIEAMDGLRTADQEHKQRFIRAYYKVLVYAPDTVIRQLNAYLQVITQPEREFDYAAQSNARDVAVWAMRQDALAGIDDKTKLKASDLYSIEVNNEPQTSVIKPPAQTQASETTEQNQPSPSDR